MSIEEKIDQAKGAAKEGVGKLTGDKKISRNSLPVGIMGCRKSSCKSQRSC